MISSFNTPLQIKAGVSPIAGHTLVNGTYVWYGVYSM